MTGDIIYKSLRIVNRNLRDHLEIEDIKCPILVNNSHYTLHQALSVYGGLDLQCSSLEEALKHLPGSSGVFLTFAGTTVALMELTVQGVNEVDSDHIRFAIFDIHSRDRMGAIAEDGSSLLPFYDTLKLLVRHIKHYAASVELVNVDFMMNYMDVVPFELSSIKLSPPPPCPPLPCAPHPPSPPVPRPSPTASPHPPTPPTRPVSPASPSVSEGHMSTPTSLPPDTDRPGTPSEDTDVGSCFYKSSQSSPDDDSPGDSPSASPAITLSDEEEGKKEDPSYELCSGHGRSRAQGPGASVRSHGSACGSARGLR